MAIQCALVSTRAPANSGMFKNELIGVKGFLSLDDGLPSSLFAEGCIIPPCRLGILVDELRGVITLVACK